VSGALDIRHLSVEIAGSPVLTDVILSIAPGAFVGLVAAMAPVRRRSCVRSWDFCPFALVR
jgi:hypothetical protein